MVLFTAMLCAFPVVLTNLAEHNVSFGSWIRNNGLKKVKLNSVVKN